VEFLVAEETVGYGPCLEVESTSQRHLSLVPPMHQIPDAKCLIRGRLLAERICCRCESGRKRARTDIRARAHDSRFQTKKPILLGTGRGWGVADEDTRSTSDLFGGMQNIAGG
jgi:hypothetical protein